MKKNSFMEGTIIATLAIVVVKILGMLYVIPFYSIVGSSGGALYSYAYNIYLIFLGISSAGLPSAISKIISEYNTLEDKTAKNVAYKQAKNIILIFASISFLLLFVFAPSIAKFIIGDISGGNTIDDVAFVIRCVSPAILVVPFLSITKGYLQGHKYVTPSSISQLIEQIVRILVILVGSYLVVKVFNGTISLAIGIAILGAFVGGFCAYVYLKNVIRKNKDKLELEDVDNENAELKKTITKKIIKYAIPFIVINIVTNIYNFTDQILVLRTLEYLKMDAKQIEFVASAISTWAPKINMVINAMAMGMTISLIPTIVSSYTKKDLKDVSDKINRSLALVFFISFPMAIGISFLREPIWQVFYNSNEFGYMILGLSVFSAVMANMYMILSTICQSLNKFKLVYLVSITGFLTNALLDVPIMLLFNTLGIPAFLGSIVASIIGFSLSVIIGLVFLHKEDNINFKFMIKSVLKTFIPSIIMLLVLIILNKFIVINNNILKIVINGIIGGSIYIIISYYLGLIENLFGREYLNKIIKKLTFGKFKLKN